MAILRVDLEHDIPEGWVPLEVVSVVKCLDDDGEPALCIRQSGGLSLWEAVGMLTTANDMARESMKGDFRERREGED